MRKIDPVLYERLATLIVSMGCELVACEMLPQGRQMLFRIYIDKLNGVTVDDCSLVSRQVSAMLDVEDAFQERYILEVSSPGIDRPLFELDHYRKYIGKLVKVRLHTPVNQRRQYKGVLQRIEENDIYLQVEGFEEDVSLPFSAIGKGNLVGEISFK